MSDIQQCIGEVEEKTGERESTEINKYILHEERLTDRLFTEAEYEAKIGWLNFYKKFMPQQSSMTQIKIVTKNKQI